MKTEKQNRRSPHGAEGRGGFTLIELLVVISIIGVLSALVVGLASGASKTGKMKRVQSDLQLIAGAIDSYYAKFNSYPPDGALQLGVAPNHSVFPTQLFYELTGAVAVNNASAFQSLQDSRTFSSGNLNILFGRDGIQNAHEDRAQVKNYIPTIKPGMVSVYKTNNLEFSALTVPVPNPNGQQNYWFYNSTNPTNNPGKFDLWAVVVIGRSTNVIGNW